MTDLVKLRQELALDPEGFGYAGSSDGQCAAILNAPRYADQPVAGRLRLRSRAEELGLGVVTKTDVRNAWLVETPVEPPPVDLPPIDPPPVDPPQVDPPPPVSQASIGTVTLRGLSAATGIISEVGYYFARGVLAAGAGICASYDGTTMLPVQMDPKTFWDDGSIRHALLALPAPANGLATNTASLYPTTAPASGPAPALASVSLTMTSATGSWTYDAVAGQDWRIGPLMREARFEAAVPEVACGSGAMRLVLDVATAANGSTVVGIALRNDAIFNAGLRPAAYGLSLRIGGNEVFAATVARHEIYAALLRTIRTGPVMPVVVPDVQHLADLGITPRINQAIGLAPDHLTKVRAEMATSTWADPFSTRGVATYMPATGGRPDIGPVPGWVGSWLSSGEPDLLTYAIGKAEALGGCPWHYWNAQAGNWLTNDQHPGLWADGRDARWAPFEYIGGDGRWTPEDAHDPEANSAIYAVTGRRMILDQMLSLAAWSVMTASPGYTRRHGTGEPGAGLLLVFTAQARACAWSIRNVALAAALAPAQDPIGEYFGRVLKANLAYLKVARSGPLQTDPAKRLAPYVEQTGWDAALGDCTGYVPAFTNGDRAAIAPWQQDFLAAVIAQTAMTGLWPDARDVAGWLAKWSVNRFMNGRASPLLGCLYTLPTMGDVNNYLTRFTTWEATEAEAIRRGFMPTSWGGFNGNDYPAGAQNALAGLLNVFPDDAAIRSAWAFIAGQATTSLTTAAMQMAPQYSATPKLS